MTQEEEVKIEDTEWKPPRGKGRVVSNSVRGLRGIKPGETKRIYHPDIVCNPSEKSCHLQHELHKLRKTQGWEVESYHEAPHIMVVRRDK